MESVVINANDLRVGDRFIHQGKIYEVLDHQHVQPGKGGAFMKLKVRSLEGGETDTLTLRSEERVSKLIVEEIPVQFLYRKGEIFYFMDMETFEEYTLPQEKVEEMLKFVKEGDTLKLLKSGEEILGVSIPKFVELKVESTPPGVKGDTASGGSKPATLETGFTLQVPLFIQPGDIIRVDTRSGKYVERVKD
ncbi:MAG TPA: elongation factor P [bacterium]|nr:elongation factor P [bacterium]HEX67639.1 elongation factor P [bacterium]